MVMASFFPLRDYIWTLRCLFYHSLRVALISTYELQDMHTFLIYKFKTDQHTKKQTPLFWREGLRCLVFK